MDIIKIYSMQTFWALTHLREFRVTVWVCLQDTGADMVITHCLTA